MTYVYKKFYILVNRIVYNCLHIEFLLIIIVLLIVTVSLINRVPRDLIRHCVELWKHITIYRSRTLFNEFWVISILCNYLERSMEIRVRWTRSRVWVDVRILCRTLYFVFRALIEFLPCPAETAARPAGPEKGVHPRVTLSSFTRSFSIFLTLTRTFRFPFGSTFVRGFPRCINPLRARYHDDELTMNVARRVIIFADVTIDLV